MVPIASQQGRYVSTARGSTFRVCSEDAFVTMRGTRKGDLALARDPHTGVPVGVGKVRKATRSLVMLSGETEWRDRLDVTRVEFVGVNL